MTRSASGLRHTLLSRVWLVRAGYHAVTGIRGLVHFESVECATGPKYDRWLVETASHQVVAIDDVIRTAGERTSITPEIAAMAMGLATGCVVIDGTHAAKQCILRLSGRCAGQPESVRGLVPGDA